MEFDNALESILYIVVLVLLLGLLLGFPIMWLWNWLMPYLFELPAIDFWQALGLYMLSSFLFKSTSTSKSK